MVSATRMPSRGGQTLAIGCAATIGVVVANLALEGHWQTLLAYSGPLALLSVAFWASLWSPYVECTPGGVTLNNVFRRVHVPWPALVGVQDRFGLTLTTAYGTYNAWSASRPKLREHTLTTGSGVHPADHVERMWRELKAAGYLDNPRLEPHLTPWTWRYDVLVAFGVSTAWTVLVVVATRM
jgi:Bacterial PH domain